MPIASMLEADKPFMFATTSTGRPATAADLASANANSNSNNANVNTATTTTTTTTSNTKPVIVATNGDITSSTSGAPALQRSTSSLQQQKQPFVTQASTVATATTAPPPSHTSISTTNNNNNNSSGNVEQQQPRRSQQVSSSSSSSPSPSPSPFYHPQQQNQHISHSHHHHHHSHSHTHSHTHQHHHHHAHHHHAHQHITGSQDDDQYMYHQQHQQYYEQQHNHHSHHPHSHHHDFRTNNTSLHGATSGIYSASSVAISSPRRLPQQQQQQQQHLHNHHHHNHSHSSSSPQQYHVHQHHIQQQTHMTQQQSSSSMSSVQHSTTKAVVAMEEPHYSAHASSTTSPTVATTHKNNHSSHNNNNNSTTLTINNNNNNNNTGNGVYASEADDSEAWYEEKLASVQQQVPTQIQPSQPSQPQGAAENKRYKKRKEYSTRIEKIDGDFMENKDRIYADKLTTIQTEIKQVHNNTHVSYVEGVAELERIRTRTIKEGQMFRFYQEQITDNQFNQEIHHAEEEYLAEKQEMREKLFATLEEKRRKLKEEKDNCELAFDIVMESQAKNRRQLRKRGLEQAESKLNKRKQLSGPALVFKLREDYIQTDLHALEIDAVSTPTSGKKVSNSSKKKS